MKKTDLNKIKLNKQSKRLKGKSTKGLTKKLSIVNGGKYFSSETFQNYLGFLSAKK